MTNQNDETLSLEWVKELLSQPVLARLATANPQNAQPHVTPVWFEWDGECVYISAFISTRKAKEVTKNPLISVLIDTDNPTRAVLFEGKAELLTEPSEVHKRSESIYARYVGREKVKNDPYQSWAYDPENRIIILRPSHVYKWNW